MSSEGCVIVPVGFSRGTIDNMLKSIKTFDCLVTVTVPGFEEIKKEILYGISLVARMLGASFYSIQIEPGNPDSIVEVYRILRKEKPRRTYLIGVTGSRYLLPLLQAVLLRYWKTTGRSEIWLVHGIEGETPTLEPLPGFLAPGLRLTNTQKKLLSLIYSSSEPLSGKTLIKKYNYTKSVYTVLSDLEAKGLLRVRRGRIEKTLPGELLYRMMREEDEA